jgi:predicted dehydrogenase
MDGARPISVFAVTQQIKPDIYPRVDDEATIIVTYPKAQAIIQASWNWPYGRKDIEIYTKNRAIIADREKMRMYWDASGKELVRKTPQREPPYNDPFLFLTAVVKGQITLGENDLSGLHVNMIAMEILDAAVRSAREGKIVKISNP